MSLSKDRNAPEFFLYKMLRNPADQSTDMDVDGSSSAVAFEYTVPSGKMVELVRLNIDIVDGGIGNNEFAGLGSVLTNGVKLEIIDTDGIAIILDFTDGEPITSNSYWAHLGGADSVIYPAAGDDRMVIRFTVAKANAGLPMVLKEGLRVRMTIRDDLTAITHMECMIQGKIY